MDKLVEAVVNRQKPASSERSTEENDPDLNKPEKLPQTMEEFEDYLAKREAAIERKVTAKLNKTFSKKYEAVNSENQKLRDDRVDRLAKDVDRTEDKVDDLKKELEKTKEELKKAQEIIKKKDEEIAELKKQKDHLTFVMETNLNTANAELEQFRRLVDSFKKQDANVSEQLKKKNEELEHLRKKMLDLHAKDGEAEMLDGESSSPFKQIQKTNGYAPVITSDDQIETIAEGRVPLSLLPINIPVEPETEITIKANRKRANGNGFTKSRKKKK
jgi:chromosome segregation ATPase